MNGQGVLPVADGMVLCADFGNTFSEYGPQ